MYTMSVEVMPVEILVMIFKNLKGTDAIACRAVCRRWRDVVDSLTDDAWKDFCHHDLGNPKTAKDVSNLSYRDLYKSLTLWSKVEEADEMCPIEPVNDVMWFKVLKNNTVAVLRSSGNIDTIEYYETQTMTVISRRTFNFNIFCCDENEHLIAMMDENGRVHVIIKSNNREFVVGEHDEISNFTLLNSELYFMSRQNMMCVARMKVVDEEETIETVELHDLVADYVVAFARAGDDGVNVLTAEGNIYSYCYSTTKLTRRVQLEDENATDCTYVELRNFGFQWSDAIIYDWLSDEYPEKMIQITKQIHAVIHTHYHVLLLGTCQSFVHVYKRSYYNENGELKTYKSEPDRTIDVKKYIDIDLNIGCIKQVDVVETLHGHRLLVLSQLCNLLTVDLLHKQLNVTINANKRRHENDGSSYTSSTKKPKI